MNQQKFIRNTDVTNQNRWGAKQLFIIVLAALVAISTISPLGAFSAPTKQADAAPVATAAVPEGTRTQKSTSTDYIVANFDGINEGQNVIEPVTYERLRKDVLNQAGNSVILLASPNNPTSKATLKYINAAAIAKGIQKVYFFDPNLAGSCGVDIIPNAANPQHNQTAAIIAGSGTTRGLWAQLTTNLHSSATGEWLHDVNANYSSDDTYLFVYNKGTSTRTAPVDGAYGVNQGIISELLIETTNVDGYVANNGTTLTPAINTVFANGGITQGTDATNFDDWHFFQTAFTESPTVESFGIDSSAKFKIESVTQPELVNVLNTPGKHNVFISGSWCGDSRAVIASIAANAYRYNETVYLYDFRVDGSSSGLANNAHTLRPEQPGLTAAEKIPANLSRFENGTEYGPASYGFGFTGVGFLGNEIVELLYPFGSGDENFVQQYYPDGDSTKALTTASQRNFRSPYLFQYEKGNNNEKGSVLKDWVHTVKEWEKPYRATSVYNWPITAGTKLDYEISTGGDFTPAQIRAGVAAISEYFTGQPNVAHTAPGTISTEISADNGCGGSDDDPLDDSGDSTLLPYNGTDDYDVSNYNLSVDYYAVGDALPDGETQATADTFVSNAIITARTNKILSTILLDLREADVDYDNVTVTAGGSSKAINQITRDDDYNVDKHKLNIALSTPIAKGTEFVVTIPYSVGTVEDSLTAPGGKPNGYTKRVDGKGFVVVGEPLGSTYWFPNNNNPADGATYNIKLSAPQNSAWRTISAGRRTANPSTSGGRTTSNWVIDTPTSPYQVFAAFGEYTELGSTTEKLTLKGGTEIQSLSFVNSTLYSTNPAARDKADTYYSQLAKYIQDIEALVGDYPGTSVGFVLDDLSDGHGESATFGAIETKWRPYYTNANLNTPESTFVHEFVHQWYGNSALLGNWADLWLNEGFATYITDLYYEQAGITSSANTRYINVYNNTAANKVWWNYPVAPVEKESDLWGGASAPYRKAGLALSVLRTAIGDAKFLQIIKEWPTAKAGVANTTADFIAFAQAQGISSADLTTWKAAWLSGVVKPAALSAFNPFPNTDPNPGQAVAEAKTALNKAITAVSTAIAAIQSGAQSGVVVSAAGDGSDVAPGVKWVSAATLKSYSVAVIAATAVLNNPNSTKAQLDKAASDLAIATANFTAAQKAGTKAGTSDLLTDSKDTDAAASKKIAKTKILSLKVAKKSFTVKWQKSAKSAKVTGYQVSYKAKGATKWKTKTVKATKGSLKITKLTKGKKYQVKVRVYKKTLNTKLYSAWSKVKTSAKIK